MECTVKAYVTIEIILRYDDTTTHSTTTEVIEIKMCVRFDYDPTTTCLARLLPFDASKKLTSFFVVVMS